MCLQDGACKLRIRGAEYDYADAAVLRPNETEALPSSFVSAHLLLGITGGEFVSLLDPAEAYREYAASCSNQGALPRCWRVRNQTGV